MVTWGLLFIKRRPVYPLIQLVKPYIKITWGLGRIRTIATPLDRHKATRKITWGLGRTRTIATPLDRRKATRKITWGLGHVQTIATPENYLGAKESVPKEQLKNRHPLSTAQNIAWGFFAIAMNKESTLVIGYQATA